MISDFFLCGIQHNLLASWRVTGSVFAFNTEPTNFVWKTTKTNFPVYEMLKVGILVQAFPIVFCRINGEFCKIVLWITIHDKIDGINCQMSDIRSLLRREKNPNSNNEIKQHNAIRQMWRFWLSICNFGIVEKHQTRFTSTREFARLETWDFVTKPKPRLQNFDYQVSELCFSKSLKFHKSPLN